MGVPNAQAASVTQALTAITPQAVQSQLSSKVVARGLSYNPAVQSMPAPTARAASVSDGGDPVGVQADRLQSCLASANAPWLLIACRGCHCRHRWQYHFR